MSRNLTLQEVELINNKAKEIIATSGKRYGFGEEADVYQDVMDQYIRQRDILQKGGDLSEPLQGFAKLVDHHKVADAYKKDAAARLSQRINDALSGPKITFGDIKRVTRDVTEAFETEERFNKMKFKS